ncbi:MAG: pyruvate kinase [Deltaproteobacteria bacterium]
MIKTKIICTIGPATSSPKMLSKLIQSGMNVARLNFSHGTHSEHKERIDTIRRISDDLNKPVAILQDLAGPKIRIGGIKSGSVILESGSDFTLTSRSVPGDENEVSVNYKKLPTKVNARDTLLLSDGSIELKVIETSKEDIICRVITGGKLSSKKGINIPAHSLDISSFTNKDKKDLDFGIKTGIDMIALSFVRNARDVEKVKRYLKKKKSTLPVIAKIETLPAIDNIDEILDAIDGIMVARGDLGVETPIEKVPITQKIIISKSNEIGKTVITATHMLKSMVHDMRPTRAEVADVANAILDGTDAVMLSEETAIGEYPDQAVKILAKIAKTMESSSLFQTLVDKFRNFSTDSDREALGLGVCNVAEDIKASAIITYTKSGYTAKTISRYRPKQIIIAITPSVDTYRYLPGVWGVIPVLTQNDEEQYLTPENMIRTALKSKVIKAGDNVVITDEAGMSIHTVE